MSIRLLVQWYRDRQDLPRQREPAPSSMVTYGKGAFRPAVDREFAVGRATWTLSTRFRGESFGT